jgi:putative tryptophan/tyrosine transport system substrate-binding protein
MQRREFFALVGGAAAWPLAARAQQTIPIIGFLTSLARNARPNLTEAFRRGLSETGFVEGRNVAIEYRFADNAHDRLPALAADLVARKVNVIAAVGGGNPVLAAKAATSTIPIVFTTGDDPIRATYVTSMNRPGGNITGVSFFSSVLSGKRLELLREMLPNIKVVAVITNPQSPEGAPSLKSSQDAASLLGLRLIVMEARTERGLDQALDNLRQQRPDAMTVVGDPFLTSRHPQIVAYAAREALPAIYANREFVDAGGLASYGNDVTDGYRRNGVYVGRILNGASPAELPVDQATKFDFVVNAKTARALGLNIPLSTLARADEVIE